MLSRRKRNHGHQHSPRRDRRSRQNGISDGAAPAQGGLRGRGLRRQRGGLQAGAGRRRQGRGLAQGGRGGDRFRHRGGGLRFRGRGGRARRRRYRSGRAARTDRRHRVDGRAAHHAEDRGQARRHRDCAARHADHPRRRRGRSRQDVDHGRRRRRGVRGLQTGAGELCQLDLPRRRSRRRPGRQDGQQPDPVGLHLGQSRGGASSPRRSTSISSGFAPRCSTPAPATGRCRRGRRSSRCPGPRRTCGSC